MKNATIEQIIEATGGKESRDGESVVIGFGSLGYLRIYPDYVISGGQETPAGRIEGRLSRANGAKHAEVRKMLEAAGLYAA